MIRFENISIVFPDKKRSFKAVDDVSFEIKQCEIFGIICSRGAGKITLLRTITLLQRPTSVNVYVYEQNITDLTCEALSKLILNI